MTDQSALAKINENLSLIVDRLTVLESGQDELRTGQDGITKRLDTLEAGQDGLITGQLKLIKQVKLNTSSLNRVKKDINYIVGEFDEGIVKNTRRIERIEKHLGLAQMKG